MHTSSFEKNRVSRPFIVLMGMAMLVNACTWEPGIDEAKFAELNRTVQELRTALASGKACDVPDAVMQRLDAQIAVMKDKATSKAERDLAASCAHLSMIYRDGLLVCRSRTLLSEFQFVPKGRIYVPQELDPVIERYGLPAERHLYKPTGQYWRSISADSISVIWESADAQIRNIENMVKYH